ncbi:hypothetical protein AXF42_Ash018984 [Apostasia shenzhenica]|uniref:Uncharacterized protein n=1 Tax=Apostasia shenzhenica TaxID=1088818 RepID=A0A2I0AC42_9ASPA|nr:hypothetical protein AXF42_Ash018984 [Apostasia shenzhenica]
MDIMMLMMMKKKKALMSVIMVLMLVGLARGRCDSDPFQTFECQNASPGLAHYGPMALVVGSLLALFGLLANF